MIECAHTNANIVCGRSRHGRFPVPLTAAYGKRSSDTMMIVVATAPNKIAVFGCGVARRIPMQRV